MNVDFKQLLVQLHQQGVTNLEVSNAVERELNYSHRIRTGQIKQPPYDVAQQLIELYKQRVGPDLPAIEVTG